MYLSQLHLDGNSRQTRNALSAPNKFHGAVESAFPGSRERNLWRIDQRGGQFYLLVLSAQKPDLTAASEQFGVQGETWQTKSCQALLERICTDSRWRFRLCANPTYSVPAGTGKRGRVCAHSELEHQIQWLIRQGEKHGFLLKREECSVIKEKWYIFKKGTTSNKVTFLAVTYDGILTVKNAERFKEALCAGIGSGKAYGAGLMTLVREGTAYV